MQLSCPGHIVIEVNAVFGDTIAAVSTAMGEAGIGIVRVSGPEAMEILSKIFRPKNPERFAKGLGYRIYYGQVFDPDSGSSVDEVLVSVMRGPNSFTGEDVVEINCHGGLVAQRGILALLLRLGAQSAEPGEFTKRAFVNGRLDLAQAEAVIDLIRAKTSLGASSALEQLRGRLSDEVTGCRNSLLEILAQIEAGIDFPEEGLDLDSGEILLEKLQNVIARIEELLSGSKRGKILREGLSTAIIGRPNVGKSSLLNALLGEERAIVTDIPGTTRDVLEEYISIKGIPLKLIDTAGIRTTEDMVERLGVDRALKALEKADLVLFVLEAGLSLTSDEKKLLAGVPQEKLVLVVNKIDLGPDWRPPVEGPTFYVSALEQRGIEELEDGIIEVVAGKQTAESAVVSNIRHINSLEGSAAKVRDAVSSLRHRIPPDVVSIDVRAAWELLGEITGETVGEDLLDEIFSRFCIGK